MRRLPSGTKLAQSGLVDTLLSGDEAPQVMFVAAHRTPGGGTRGRLADDRAHAGDIEDPLDRIRDAPDGELDPTLPGTVLHGPQRAEPG